MLSMLSSLMILSNVCLSQRKGLLEGGLYAQQMSMGFCLVSILAADRSTLEKALMNDIYSLLIPFLRAISTQPCLVVDRIDLS